MSTSPVSIPRPVGFLTQHCNEPKLCPVDFFSLRRGMDHEDADALAAYLRGGSIVVVVLGVEFDCQNESVIAGTLSMLSDGHWIWPDYLAYYVSRYGIELAPEFLAHVQSRSWKSGALSDDEVAAISRSMESLFDHYESM